MICYPILKEWGIKQGQEIEVGEKEEDGSLNHDAHHHAQLKIDSCEGKCVLIKWILWTFETHYNSMAWYLSNNDRNCANLFSTVSLKNLSTSSALRAINDQQGSPAWLEQVRYRTPPQLNIFHQTVRKFTICQELCDREEMVINIEGSCFTTFKFNPTHCEWKCHEKAQHVKNWTRYHLFWFYIKICSFSFKCLTLNVVGLVWMEKKIGERNRCKGI